MNPLSKSPAADLNINPGSLKPELETTYKSLDDNKTTQRLFSKDASLWKSDPENVKSIDNRLGWLILPESMLEKSDELIAFADQIKSEGYKHAVLLGMGGSSLCSEVARVTFGSSDGYPELFVLDNTSPEAILDLQKQIDIEKTLFIAASKSGNTKETLSFYKYFYDQLIQKGKTNPGDNFIAITDADTPLVKAAADHHFRKVFINPTDIGGRYSVLSYFGIVPMALMGIDIRSLLQSAKQMEEGCQSTSAADNDGISLGALLGVCQQHGRDKVTFILSSSINSFGYWAEQLLAESTGKEGKGLIPVNGEDPGAPKVYGADRIFIYMYLDSDDNTSDENKVKQLEDAGHPVVRIAIKDTIALGGEFYRWEAAVAVAGVIIGINPFDEPNVAESKKNTDNLLEEWKGTGVFKKSEPLLDQDGIAIYGNDKLKQDTGIAKSSIGELIGSFTGLSGPHDYIALLPYFEMTASRTKILQAWRQQIRNDRRAATTLLNGPRYLHSTGQLHKGGPDTGLYIIITAEEDKDLAIPEEKYGFATLHQAQALGDYRSLDDKGRRVIRIGLGKNIDEGLYKIWQAVHKNK
jgi:transaldolase/glucose-6-phosphate isomerase